MRNLLLVPLLIITFVPSINFGYPDNTFKYFIAHPHITYWGEYVEISGRIVGYYDIENNKVYISFYCLDNPDRIWNKAVTPIISYPHQPAPIKYFDFSFDWMPPHEGNFVVEAKFYDDGEYETRINIPVKYFVSDSLLSSLNYINDYDNDSKYYYKTYFKKSNNLRQLWMAQSINWFKKNNRLSGLSYFNKSLRKPLENRYYENELIGAVLPGINLSNFNLKDIYINATDFRYIQFSNNTLKNVNFHESDLSYSNFYKVYMDTCYFSSAILYKVNFNNISGSYVCFFNTILKNNELSNINIKEIDFNMVKAYNSNISGIDIKNSTFQYVHIDSSNLSYIDIYNVDFFRVNFSTTDLRFSKFSNCHFKNVYFTDCNLIGANFNKSKFDNCDFKNVKICLPDIVKLPLEILAVNENSFDFLSPIREYKCYTGQMEDVYCQRLSEVFRSLGNRQMASSPSQKLHIFHRQ